MSRRHNPERAHLHRSYTILEIAALFNVGKTAVGGWIRAGLTPVDRKRPLIFTGCHIRAFLKARMAATKRPLTVGEIFCVACKRAQVPQDGRAEFEIVSPTSCNVIGRCPDCARRIFRRVRLANLVDDSRGLMLTPGVREDRPTSVPTAIRRPSRLGNVAGSRPLQAEVGRVSTASNPESAVAPGDFDVGHSSPDNNTRAPSLESQTTTSSVAERLAGLRSNDKAGPRLVTVT